MSEHMAVRLEVHNLIMLLFSCDDFRLACKGRSNASASTVLSVGASMPIDAQFDKSFPNAIFVSNVPSVAKEKYDKLMGILKKHFDKHGKCEKYMPLNEETQMTDGGPKGILTFYVWVIYQMGGSVSCSVGDDFKDDAPTVA
eukprot:6347587-Amphidinium_carterae.1